MTTALAAIAVLVVVAAVVAGLERNHRRVRRHSGWSTAVDRDTERIAHDLAATPPRATVRSVQHAPVRRTVTGRRAAPPSVRAA